MRGNQNSKKTKTAEIISLSSRRPTLVESHSYLLRREQLLFLHDEIFLVESEPYEPNDDRLVFTMTLNGLKHFKIMFVGYGLDFERIQIYGELRSCWFYIFDLASNLGRWTLGSEQRREQYRDELSDNPERLAVLNALFAGDVKEVKRLHMAYGTQRRIFDEYMIESDMRQEQENL